MPLTPNDLEVHLKHYKDGFPLCWDRNQTGTFEATFLEDDVTCKTCVGYLEE